MFIEEKSKRVKDKVYTYFFVACTKRDPITKKIKKKYSRSFKTWAEAEKFIQTAIEGEKTIMAGVDIDSKIIDFKIKERQAV